MSLYINIYRERHMYMQERVWKASGKIVYRINSAAIFFDI